MPRSTNTVAVQVDLAPHLLRRLDAIASKLDMDRGDAIRTAVMLWLQQEERNAACHDRMLKVRATASGAARTA